MSIRSFFSLSVLFLFSHSYAQEHNPFVNSGEIIKKAYQYSDSNSYLKAVDILDTISESDTAYIDALYLIALNYSNAEKYEAAIKAANLALQQPSKYNFRLNLIKANAFDDLGYRDSALNVYNSMLKKYPFHYLIYYNMGIVYRNDKQYDKAIRAFQQSIMYNPFYASSHLAMGKIMANMGLYTKAILCYETFLAIEPNSSRSNSILVFLNDFVNNATSNEEKIDKIIDNKAFDELDQLI